LIEKFILPGKKIDFFSKILHKVFIAKKQNVRFSIPEIKTLLIFYFSTKRRFNMPVDPTATCFSKADMNRSVTALMVYEAVNGGWVVRGKATSGSNGNHAEEELAADMNGANKLNISNGASIYIEITKSPCHYHEGEKCCSNVLANLKTSGRVSSIEVKYLGIYESRSHSNTWRSISGLVELEANDISADAWNPTTSVNASQTVFMNQYQQNFNNGTLGSGYWTNPQTRYDQTQKQPSNKFWTAEM
jgi:pyrimidine deaminase RibD-like protein